MATILIADDDVGILESMTFFARARGYEVHTTQRGDDAFELAKELRPDVILLDVKMPGLDGRDVMRKLRSVDLPAHTVILFVSARDSQHDRHVGLDLGADDYETKPLHFGQLFDKIAHLRDKKAAALKR